MNKMVQLLRQNGNTVETEVTLILPGDPPVAARLDILGTNTRGVLQGVEIKTGAAPTYTPDQAIVSPHAVGGAGVISPDEKIKNLGLDPGRPLPAFEIMTVYAREPGADLVVITVPAVPIGKKERRLGG